jgi:hypothetical protein
MKLTKLITNTIVIAGIALTTLAESADARSSKPYSHRGGDGAFVNAISVLVDELADGTPITTTNIGANTVLFKGAVEDLIKTSFDTISLVSPVVFNADGIPVDLGGCRTKGVYFADGSYRKASGKKINFTFNAQGKVRTPRCAKTVESFNRFSRADLKAKFFRKDSEFNKQSTIQYSIVAQTPEGEVVEADIGKLLLSSRNFDRDKALKDISYILENNLLEEIFNVESKF